MATRDHGLAEGVEVEGLDPLGRVTLTAVEDIGVGVRVTWRDDIGRVSTRLLLPGDLDGLTVHGSPGRTFDAVAERVQQAVQALCLRYAHSTDPLLAVSASAVEPLPHQIMAVYEDLLPRDPLRFVLADDPGAGKTIMAGLFIREALARGRSRRILVIVPGSLATQWEAELREKFGLNFTVFERSLVDESDEHPVYEESLLIARIDQFARDEDLKALLEDSEWDLVVVDEAHKMTARRSWGRSIEKSKRYQLGELVRDVARDLLLMTATPHNGKEDEFQLWLRLLDADRFAGPAGSGDDAPLSDVMRRLVKEQLRHADGRPLFPERRAVTVPYTLSPDEQDLYERVTDYVRHEMNKAADSEKQRTVGFALLVLQRRLASSTEAILRSLERRVANLAAEAERLREARERDLTGLLSASLDGVVFDEDDDELEYEQLTAAEDEAAGAATAARTVEDLETELLVLDDLVERARHVRASGIDTKWAALESLLLDGQMFDEEGRRRKLIVFTEHRDTLDYLHDRIDDVLGYSSTVVVVHGGVTRPQRAEAIDQFWHDDHTSVLLATDAAGEGVNLQVAHLMVNYDLPWNPNRLEQRFGRIHRIGQDEVCWLWNLVAEGTREGDVFSTLLGKLETQREALGDKVFDVLGQVLTGRDLRELLSDALRYGDSPEVRARLERTMQERVGEDLAAAANAHTEGVSELSDADLRRLRTDLRVSQIQRLTPHVVQPFVHRAMASRRGDLREARPGRFRVSHVPPEVRAAGNAAARYRDVVFDQEFLAAGAGQEAELLAPGHPLVDGLVKVLLEDNAGAAASGTTLEDPCSTRDAIVAFMTYEMTIGGDVTERHAIGIRVFEDGSAEEVAPAFLLGLPAGPDAPLPAWALAAEDHDIVGAARRVASTRRERVQEQVTERARRRARAARTQLGLERAELGRRLRISAERGNDEEVRQLQQAQAGVSRRLEAVESQPVPVVEIQSVTIEAAAFVRGTASPASLRERETAADTAVAQYEEDGWRVTATSLPGGGWTHLLERGDTEWAVVPESDAVPGRVELVERNIGSDRIISLQDN